MNALLGADTTLPCDHGFEKALVYIAQWFKDPQPGGLNDPIAQKFDTTWTVSEKFNLTENFGLRVSSVSVEDEGTYKCFISPPNLQEDYIEFVQLGVSAYPSESASLIEGCGSSSDAACHHTGSMGETMPLTCQASHVYPETYPSWTIATMVSKTSTQHPDGSFTTSVDIEVVIDRAEMEIVCVFQYGDYSRSSRLRITALVPSVDYTSTVITTTSVAGEPVEAKDYSAIVTAVVVIVFVILIVAIVLAVFFVRKKRFPCQGYCREKPPEKDKSSDYVPVPPTEDRRRDSCHSEQEESRDCVPALPGKDTLDYCHSEQEPHASVPTAVRRTVSAEEKRKAFWASKQETILGDDKLEHHIVLSVSTV